MRAKKNKNRNSRQKQKILKEKTGSDGETGRVCRAEEGRFLPARYKIREKQM